MENEQYLRDWAKAVDAVPDEVMITYALKIMKSYGDFHWWESDESDLRAYMQIRQPCLLIPWEKFHGDMEKLLGRPVWTHEFGIRYKELLEEATQAYAGIKRQPAQAMQDAMDVLYDWAKNTGKPIVTITPEMSVEEAVAAVEAMVSSLEQSPSPDESP